jgi:hypothetical protein
LTRVGTGHTPGTLFGCQEVGQRGWKEFFEVFIFYDNFSAEHCRTFGGSIGDLTRDRVPVSSCSQGCGKT